MAGSLLYLLANAHGCQSSSCNDHWTVRWYHQPAITRIRSNANRVDSTRTEVIPVQITS